jgi:hypothetical protein
MMAKMMATIQRRVSYQESKKEEDKWVFGSGD